MGMTGMTPQMLQQIAAALQRPQAQPQSNNGQPQGAGPLPQGAMSQASAAPGAQQPPIPGANGVTPQLGGVGGSNLMLPSGTAAPAVPGVPMSATPPRQPGAMRANGIASLPAAVFAMKQKFQQDKVTSSRYGKMTVDDTGTFFAHLLSATGA